MPPGASFGPTASPVVASWTRVSRNDTAAKARALGQEEPAIRRERNPGGPASLDLIGDRRPLGRGPQAERPVPESHRQVAPVPGKVDPDRLVGCQIGGEARASSRFCSILHRPRLDFHVLPAGDHNLAVGREDQILAPVEVAGRDRGEDRSSLVHPTSGRRRRSKIPPRDCRRD